MRDSTVLTTQADVYIGAEPSTSASVMRSGDSPPPLRASIPSVYDETDDAGIIGKPSIGSSGSVTIKPLRTDDEDSAIEEAVPIVRSTLPSPAPQPKIETNGHDKNFKNSITDLKNMPHDPDDDPFVIKCVYFTQQCCECSIL